MGFLPEMERLEEMSTERLFEELKLQKTISDENYWGFTRCAGSKCSGYLKAMANADEKIRKIKEEIRRRKRTAP